MSAVPAYWFNLEILEVPIKISSRTSVNARKISLSLAQRRLQYFCKSSIFTGSLIYTNASGSGDVLNTHSTASYAKSASNLAHTAKITTSSINPE